ncbi:LIS1 [[Candida] subhashii]|uniref:Nuclear distribution protein PAC1 n=1 Tax=[Candida] subhashii TaxID=561895 RepID=A0A8J5QVF0_9ASCO|nr:LIS1 [[Candida] subhashii]KAG7662950.1 LIS1 [[Candida] subhashii]
MIRSQILTERQQKELNKSIIQYLEPIINNNNNQQQQQQQQGEQENILNQLSTILQVDQQANNEIVSNYLEKKWSSVLRLQKKIIDLENEVHNLRSILDVSDTNNNNNKHVISKDRINWLPSTCSRTFITQSNQLINTIKIHPILPNIYCGCNDGSIYVWNMASDEDSIPEKIIRAHTKAVNAIEWSLEPVNLTSGAPHTKPSYIFASCSSDLTIKIWDEANYRYIRTLTGHEHTISSIKFSSNNSTILYSVSRDKTVKIWDLINGICINSFIGHSDWVRDLDVISINNTISLQALKTTDNSLGDFILTCSNDQSARLSHINSRIGLAVLIGHTHVVETVKFLPMHSNHIIDSYIKSNSEFFPSIPLDLLETSSIYGINLGFKYCLTGSRDNTIKLWLLPPPILSPHRPPQPSQYNNSQAWLISDIIGHSSWVKSLSIHPNGKFFFSGSDDKTIKVWDLSTLNISGKIDNIRTLKGHEGFVSSIDFARLLKRKENNPHDEAKPQENGSKQTDTTTQEQLLRDIQQRMRCVFISGGTDNSIRVWN